MHVLRQVHEALVPGGLVLDVHPVPPAARIESRERSLGRIRATEFLETVRATEAGLARTVASGLFAPERTLYREVSERFADGAEALETIGEWEGVEIPPALRARIEAAPGPVEAVERVIFQRLRALPR